MSTNNKYNDEAKAKIKELVEDIDFNMFLTGLSSTPPNAAPMSTKQVDAEGNLWFLSTIEHDTVTNILTNPEVQLCYNNPGNMEFLSVFGHARIVSDKAKLEELYGKMDDTWFDGVDDPNLRAIAVTPQEAQYWEPKNNKVVTLFKMAYGAITGDKVEIGEEGHLRP